MFTVKHRLVYYQKMEEEEAKGEEEDANISLPPLSFWLQLCFVSSCFVLLIIVANKKNISEDSL